MPVKRAGDCRPFWVRAPARGGPPRQGERVVDTFPDETAARTHLPDREEAGAALASAVLEARHAEPMRLGPLGLDVCAEVRPMLASVSLRTQAALREKHARDVRVFEEGWGRGANAGRTARARRPLRADGHLALAGRAPPRAPATGTEFVCTPVAVPGPGAMGARIAVVHVPRVAFAATRALAPRLP